MDVRDQTTKEIRRAIKRLAEKGLIVDSGRKRWSAQTGPSEIVWTLSPVARDSATKSISPLLSW
jgi:hypothetical protein